MASYLTLEEFSAMSLAPASFIAEIESYAPGWTLSQLEDASRWIDARLRKRYAAPFSEPYPRQVQAWLARLVTVRVFLRRGVDPLDRQFEVILQDAEDAKKEIAEAADSVTGLFDLPLASGASGISKGGPLYYSEQSPYVWMTRQGFIGREEDRNGEGTGNL